MVRHVVKRVHKFLITLRFSILSIFVTLFVIAMLVLIYISYHQASRAILYGAIKLMNQVATNVYTEFSDEIEKIEKDSELSSLLIRQNLINPDSNKEMIDYTVDLASQFFLVQAAYWGDEKGNYIKAEYDTDNTIMSELIDTSSIVPEAKRIYRDSKLKVINEKTLPKFDFDPRKRVWYRDAVAAKKPIWIGLYQFQPSGMTGLTLATPVYKTNGELRGVFGLDISLDWLSWYVSEYNISPNAIIFITTNAGELVAHSKLYNPKKSFHTLDINKLNTPWIATAFSIFKKTKKENFEFVFQNNKYLANFKLIPQFGKQGWVIGIVLPKEDFVGELRRMRYINTWISIIILALGILLVSFLVTKVVRPIKNLVKETDRIRHFKLGGGQKVKTIIKEVMSLSDAIYAMKLGLKSFQKYIPAFLVKQLIEEGVNAKIGGIKKPLTIMFSDIVDFTKIAENVEPNLLLNHMCDYFDELSKIIAKEEGTIDKYIGDSIMAFWGAPIVVKNPSIKAARATLQCERRLKELNAQWQKEKKPLLYTRFGLHIGEAIVGNVGSSERLNYTALGDAINVASRLEGVNKIYGTNIIVSEVVYHHIQHKFILRMIDKITVRGKKSIEIIYELLAERKDELTFDFDDYQKAFKEGFKAYQDGFWDDAIHYFNKCLLLYPHDTVAPVFISRSENFKSHPPKSWDGVWRIVG